MTAASEPEVSPSTVSYDREAISRINGFAQDLKVTHREFGPHEYDDEAAVAAEKSLVSFQKAMRALLTPAKQAHETTMRSELLAKLSSAHGLTLAVAAEIDAMAASVAAPAAAPQRQGWLNSLLHLLGKLANWIWGVIQTLLTPKGWSVEGGVTIPGLIDARLTIEFGQ